MATILIVDDYSDIRTCLRTMLEQAGHVILEAASGQEALQTWNTTRPDLVITDYSMPGMSGVELIDALGQRHPHARGILMSADRDPRDVFQSDHAPTWPFLQKPFAFRVLRQVIDSLLVTRPSDSNSPR